MNKRQQYVRSILVVVAMVIGVLAPVLMGGGAEVVAAEPVQLTKVHLDATVSTGTHLEEALAALDELEVSVEVEGFDKTNLVPYAPKGSLAIIDRYVVALDSPPKNADGAPATAGRFMVTFRFRVLQPNNADLVLRDPFGAEFAVANPFRSIDAQQAREPLTLDAITPPTPRTGTRKPVVLVVDFSDRQANAVSTPSFYQSLLFDSTVPRSTMQDYFYDMSYGQLDVAGTVYGSGGTAWIRLPQTFAYYNTYTDVNDHPNVNQFFTDVVAAADPIVNFAGHDGNGDDWVDGLIIIYAGRADMPWSKGLWPSAWGAAYSVDGKVIDRITVQAEYGSTPGDTGISVFCHEYAHVMGARDFYDYDVPRDSYGLGYWTLMANDNKQYIDPWHRYYMGWAAPVTVSAATTHTVNRAESASASNTIYKVWINPPNEYFLLENRQQAWWDTVLPGAGLLIYHIDEGVATGNNKQWYPGYTSNGHYFCALEQADGAFELEQVVNRGNSGDPWPGLSGATEFTDSTVPDTRGYAGVDTGIRITAISASADVMTFTTGDAFEPDDDQASAKVITTDGSLQRHNFAATGDVDWVKFTAVAGTTYTIDTLNLESNCDTMLELYGPPGIIDENDDNGDGAWASRMDFECPAGKGGTYYIRVWQVNGSYGPDTGYDLRVQPALQVTFSNADNAGKDYGFIDVLNHVTVTVTRGGVPVVGASVDVDWGTSALTTNAGGQASFTYQNYWSTYSYLRVSSGDSKVTSAYFWVIDPTYNSCGLIAVKPADINGYYLTRFALATFHPSGAGWWSWNSGAYNTAVLPFTGVAVATAPSDQHGGGGYVFTLNPTLTAGEKTVLLPNASADCAALSISATLDGLPLTSATVYLRNQAYPSTATSYAARTDASGASVTYVTPGTYTAAVKKSNYSTPSIWLTKKDVAASSSTSATVEFTTAQLGTLTCTALDGSGNAVEYNYLYLQSEGIFTSVTTTPANSTFLFSPGTYQEVRDSFYVTVGGTLEEWVYQFASSATHTVTAGSTASVTFGGPLMMTVNTPSPVIPGQDVATKLTVTDPQGHRLYYVYGYADSPSTGGLAGKHVKGTDPLAEHEERSGFTRVDGTDVRPPAEADAWGWVYPNPRLLITDPAAVVKVDRQDGSLSSAYGSGYAWTVPADATPGTWNAGFTFDTGVYQGVITTDQTFTVVVVPPDVFEPDGDQANAKTIAADGSLQRHNFAASGDVDWVKFTAVAGTTYTIDTLNTEANAYPAIDLLALDGTSMIDQSYSWESRIDFECPTGKGGTYYVRVWQQYVTYGFDTGYDLRVQPALQVAFSNADNAGKDYGFTDVLNHVTVTITHGGTPVAGASVTVDGSSLPLTTDASGQATFTVQKSWDTYSYLRVTSGTSKATEAYFWVIEPTSALIAVKPADVSGYYLTRFSMDAWDLVGGSSRGSWGSGASNSLTLPATVSSSNLAVITAPGDQHGGTGYLFTLSPVLTAGQKTVLLPNASTDCVALTVSAEVDGLPLTDAYVFLRNQAYASATQSYAAVTNSSGASIIYVTPGTYTAVAKTDNYSSPSVWLMKKSIVASSPTSTSIAFTTTQLGTLTCTGLDGNNNPADSNSLYLKSEGISTSLNTTPSNSTLLLSPGTYEEWFDYVFLYPSGTSERWGYGFDSGTTRIVTAGSVTSVTFGGPLVMTVATPSFVSPGQNVTTRLTVADPQGHRLYYVYGYADLPSPAGFLGGPLKGVYPSALRGGLPVFTPDNGMDVRPPAAADAWGWVYPNPHLRVADPAAVVKVDRQDVGLDEASYVGYAWTVPTDALAGTWYAGFTFDSGAYQGVIATAQAFTVVSAGVSPLITHYYSSLLSRSPDEPGRLYWLSEITRLQSLGIDVREGFIALARLFLTSPEYLARNTTDAAYVTDLYVTFFNRDPDAPGLTHWTGLMADGMSRDITMNWFVYSPEYAAYMTAVLGSLPTRPENNLVNDLYRGFLNRLPDTAGFTAQLTAMRTAQALDAAAVRATTLAIALAFQGGPEYALRSRTDAQFVEDCYNGILRRGALAAEIQYWMNFLAEGNTRAETLTSFVGSAEFQFRVDQVIAAGPYVP